MLVIRNWQHSFIFREPPRMAPSVRASAQVLWNWQYAVIFSELTKMSLSQPIKNQLYIFLITDTPPPPPHTAVLYELRICKLVSGTGCPPKTLFTFLMLSSILRSSSIWGHLHRIYFSGFFPFSVALILKVVFIFWVPFISEIDV